ncbi:organic cation transporter-like protein isoform X2 [Tubulanus polymorphus]|uniref:organic cation transporter-like protein isoform X2 n=1 Tax=Tubulanus polymorphus TaxID=672921 RepID=UPI003DA5E18A
MEVEAALKDLGRYGRYQMLQLFIIEITTLAMTMCMLGPVFQGWIPEHHCFLANYTTVNQTLNQSIPYSTSEDGEIHFDQCRQFKSSTDNATIVCQNGYYYQSNGYYTLTEQFSWVCESSYMNALVMSIYFGGVLAGGILVPPWSDYFGRKIPYIVCSLLLAVSMLLPAIFVNETFFITMKFFSGFFNTGTFIVSYVLVCEWFPTDQRSFANLIHMLTTTVGMLVMGICGYLFTHWKYIQIIAGVIPCFAILGIWLYDESVAWLVANSRTEEAIRILRKAAKFNKRSLSPSAIFAIRKTTETAKRSTYERSVVDRVKLVFTNMLGCTKGSEDSDNETIGILEIFKHPKLRLYTILEAIIWCCTSLIYYGLTLSTTVMAGGRFANYFLGAAIELPSYLVMHFSLQYIGRRISLVGLNAITGLVLIAATFCPEMIGETNLVPLIMTFNTIGKFCCTAAYGTIYIHTSELYPTNFRNRAVGIASAFARIGSMTAPFAAYLAQFMYWLPGVIIGCIGLVTALLVLPLPETRDVPMPQTISDVDRPENNAISQTINTNELQLMS